MKEGHPKITGQDMDEEMRGEINGGCAIEVDERREHRKAYRVMNEREAGREAREEEEEGMMDNKVEQRRRKQSRVGSKKENEPGLTLSRGG